MRISRGNQDAFWDEIDEKLNGYYPVTAQESYRLRRQRLRLFQRQPSLRGFVIEKLRSHWSPEQIAGYLKRSNPARLYACMETIYQFVYSDEGRELGLYSYLFRGRKHRRRRCGRKARSKRIPEQYSIIFRPKAADDRSTAGHWEADLMMFSREIGKYNITSLIERASRYTVLAYSDEAGH
jgi:transposase, IS30 family